MSLNNVYHMLEGIAELSSTLAKEELLGTALEDPDFLKVCQYTLDPRKRFKTKKLPPFQENANANSVANIFDMLDRLAFQTGASKHDKESLAYHASIDEETWEVVYRICNGDLRCGIGQRMINKVKPKTIPFTPYLRCSSKRQIHKATFPAIWQVKANGKYSEMVCTDKIVFGSRDSHKIKNVKHLKKLYNQVRDQFRHKVYMGELRVWNEDGSIMDRQAGNGIINTKKLDKKIAKRIFFSLWDCVPYDDYMNEKCDIPYDIRLDSAKDMVAAIDDEKAFQIIDTIIVKTLEEAQKLTNEEIANGGEGGVLKKTKAKWKHGTSLEQFKMKRVLEAEVVIVGWEHGDKGKKHEHRMGRIFVESSDGGVYSAVGGGFSDKLREENWDNHIGRIIEVEYEETTLAKGATKYALSGPASFVCFRDSRKQADATDEIVNR